MGTIIDQVWLCVEALTEDSKYHRSCTKFLYLAPQGHFDSLLRLLLLLLFNKFIMLCFYPLATLSFATFVSARPLPLYRRQNAVTDFGSCNATPDIIFALGLDGRKDPSFQAKNNDVYNRKWFRACYMRDNKQLINMRIDGSALGIGVITSFICQQLNDKCKAPQATLDACASGQAAAAKVTGGAAADSL
ncbi:hypothetical protein AG1IA_09149 [Rhizoctonia solani AG-1 IA]|uniref:Uncharacterized protein n=1 Tax=Thanatephorus cucumeris (strain AG1-IA) TaxID=983506 RepID=L8WKE7_THACA|nr:hypothetical protein AG1IA_09149 [Rhizoctonia solani AG-1 IA]